VSSDPNPRISERIVFRGRVQGVGFRYSVCSLAKRYPVVGYVRNLSDGTVEMLVRGNRRDIADFVLRIGEQFRGNISRVDSSAAEIADSLTGFEIRF
jgi:acylphosphatase